MESIGGAGSKLAQAFLQKKLLERQESWKRKEFGLREALVAARTEEPLSGSDLLNRWRLEQLGKMTPEQQQQYMLKPPVSITMPTGQALLTPPKRLAMAEADYEKKIAQEPLTPTELKGVKATIQEIMGEGRALPFGARLGAALSQDDMSSKWEEAMEAIGYAGRNKIQQKQVESEFDRYIATLNKGKGIGVLKGQYQWNRSKYGLKKAMKQPERYPMRQSPILQAPKKDEIFYRGPNITKEQFKSTYRRLNPQQKQAYINSEWRPEFGRNLD